MSEQKSVIFCLRCGHSEHDHLTKFTLLPSINCKTFVKERRHVLTPVGKVQDYHFEISLEFDCRGYKTELQHHDMIELKRELEIKVRDVLRKHPFNITSSLKLAKPIEIPRRKRCVECKTELELWNEDFDTDNTHWYCPKCGVGMA